MTSPIVGSVQVQVIGDDAGVQAMLRKLDTALDPSAVAAFLGATIEPYFRERARQRFQSEGDDVVGRWVPLAEATKAIRVQMGYGEGPINRRTGALENYIINSPTGVGINPAGATLTMPGDKGSASIQKKMKAAQQGLDNPRTPARPVVGMNEKDLAFTLEAFALYIQRVAR